MLMEIDQVVVDAALWRQARNGCPHSCAELRTQLNGIALYSHAMPVKDDETVVALRDLEAAGIIESVVTKAREC